MNSGKVLLGLVLVALGTVLVLGQAGVVDAGEVIATWWPAAIVAAGLLAMIGRPPAILGGGLVALVGLGALGVTTGVLGDIGFGAVGGAALILLGLWFAFGRRTAPATDDDTVQAVCVFSGQEIASVARPFRGGSITGIFGGVELDLTGAALKDGATLDATAIFGGSEVTVPPGWRVEMNGPAIFGGFENGAGRQVLPPDAPVLNVRVLALFGGVEVKLGAPPYAPPVDLLEESMAR